MSTVGNNNHRSIAVSVMADVYVARIALAYDTPEARLLNNRNFMTASTLCHNDVFLLAVST